MHNNYLTLPVLFTMLAGHFAFVFGHEDAWLALVLIAVLLAGVRHFFNLWHEGRRAWWILAAAAVAVVALALWLAAGGGAATGGEPVVVRADRSRSSRSAARRATAGARAPLGVRLETRQEIEARAEDIERVAVLTQVMPPGNATGMTEDERELLGAWIATEP